VTVPTVAFAATRVSVEVVVSRRRAGIVLWLAGEVSESSPRGGAVSIKPRESTRAEARAGVGAGAGAGVGVETGASVETGAGVGVEAGAEVGVGAGV
jgi:hypothetical protein